MCICSQYKRDLVLYKGIVVTKIPGYTGFAFKWDAEGILSLAAFRLIIQHSSPHISQFLNVTLIAMYVGWSKLNLCALMIVSYKTSEKLLTWLKQKDKNRPLKIPLFAAFSITVISPGFTD